MVTWIATSRRRSCKGHRTRESTTGLGSEGSHCHLGWSREWLGASAVAIFAAGAAGGYLGNCFGLP